MQVRKGEKATTIFFVKPLEVENKNRVREDEDSPATRLIYMLKAYSVFSLGTQIDGAPPYKPPTFEEAPWTRPDAAQTILTNSKATIRIGGDRAFYSPSTDHIQLPPDVAFREGPQWAATALHELGHCSGAKHRLDRDQSGSFGSVKYSEEELVAELHSYFVCSNLNLPTDCTQNAAYLGHWAAKLKSDNRAIFKAAALAQKAADFTLGFHPDFAPDARAESAPRPLDRILPASALPRPNPLGSLTNWSCCAIRSVPQAFGSATADIPRMFGNDKIAKWEASACFDGVRSHHLFTRRGSDADMSRHSFEADANGQPATVTVGYDRPLDYVFCQVIDRQGDVLDSNLDDPDAGCDQRDINYFVPILKAFGIEPPKDVLKEVALDQLHRIGNRNVIYGPEKPGA